MNELKSGHMADRFNRILSKEITVRAKIEKVWAAWTTTEGVQSFFSNNAKVELRVGGEFEIFFQMDSPVGSRGSERCRILSYLPNQMLSFEWNAPPDFGDLRNQHTHVVILFDQPQEGRVRLRLSHLGWGSGEDWDKLYDYFDRAWTMVLQWFEKSLDSSGSGSNDCCD